MKKKTISNVMALVLGCSTLLSVAACGQKNSANNKGKISVDPLAVEELGAGFNTQYLPDKSQINQFSGKIDVSLDF